MYPLKILAAGLALVSSLTTQVLAREDQRLDAGWHFKLGEVQDAEKSGLDASNWQTVSLPHCWGWQEAQAGRNYYRGPGWYRRELEISAQPDKRYFLRFEAASLVAEVYLNGKLLGEHRGGFGAFCFEITKQLSDTGTNLLAVRVDNARAPDIAPLEGDFSVYGGLYRPVHLITTDAENFSLTDHGSPGVVWSQTSVSETQAVLDVTAQISNGTQKKSPLKLVASILDAEGKAVLRSEQVITLAPRDTAPYFLRLRLPQPHLWNGRKDPYLYQSVVELRTTNDVVVDSVGQALGLRYYSVDPDRGFFLNGRPCHLHGVDRHQDFMGKGWAISEADMDEDIALLKELGATVVRCAHYQHSDYFYSLCDRAGILVWAEIPQVNVIRDTPEFENTSRSQLLDLIRQSLNHPAIFVWSLSNEIGNSDDPHRELQDLSALAHGEDPTRPTIEATMTPARPQMNKIPDLLGWNIYPGWYGGAKENYGRELDTRRDSSRHGGFCVSEYGAGANTAQHEQNPKQPKPGGQWHPEEWQAEVHEAAWAALKQRPFVWGTFVWCMFDFAVSTRHEGGQPGLNDKGLVTRDRKTKKDAFYFYQANWSDEPVLYLASRRFTERTNAVTDVKIYSNAQEPELFINGVSQGKRGDGENGVFLWKNLTLSPGENKISATAQRNGQTLSDECVWKLSAPQPAR
jgi:beta-galactosidase